jgi:hypothetical protein
LGFCPAKAGAQMINATEAKTTIALGVDIEASLFKFIFAQ